MSYKIRYGSDRFGQDPGRKRLRLRLLASGGLLLLNGLMRLWPKSAALSTLLFSADPMTSGERALSALADALAGGAGWYRALAVWCRCIIDGAAV